MLCSLVYAKVQGLSVRFKKWCVQEQRVSWDELRSVRIRVKWDEEKRAGYSHGSRMEIAS